MSTGFDILQNMALKIPNSSIAKALRTPQEELLRQIKLLSSAAETIRDFGRRQQQMRHAAFAPLEEMRKAGKELERMQNLSRAGVKQLCLPQTSEVAKMLLEYKSDISATLQRYQEQASNLKRMMEAMRTPWLDMENKLQSLKGFATLQGIGHALHTMPPFDTRLADALRADLGDWRNEIAWPREIFIDPQARTSFYEERGLNPALTAFPADAFEQSAVTVNINVRVSSVPVAQNYSLGLEIETDINESDLHRIKAHILIYRLETQIRKYIDERMEDVFGVNWVENRVPKKIRQRWLNRQQEAKRNGDPKCPLIAYAAFTDYVKVITQDGNWQDAFESTFSRKDSVQESFRRLVPIRNCVMHHTKPITHVDVFYLEAETHRILKAIGIGI